MPGAKLFFLQRNPRLGVQLANGLFHRLGAMAGDHDDIFGLKAAAGGQRVANQRHATQTMQHLGQIGLHPAALPCGQNDQCDGFLGHHGPLRVSILLPAFYLGAGRGETPRRSHILTEGYSGHGGNGCL